MTDTCRTEKQNSTFFSPPVYYRIANDPSHTGSVYGAHKLQDRQSRQLKIARVRPSFNPDMSSVFWEAARFSVNEGGGIKTKIRVLPLSDNNY